MRLQRDLIEAVREEAILILQELRKHAEQLLVEIHLVHAVALVERRHGAPAHVHRGEHMRGGPIEHALELIPIIDVLEPQMLDGGARDDQTVVAIALVRLKRFIELH